MIIKRLQKQLTDLHMNDTIKQISYWYAR